MATAAAVAAAAAAGRVKEETAMGEAEEARVEGLEQEGSGRVRERVGARKAVAVAATDSALC